MTNLVRIRSHPTDTAAVILDIPYELNSELRKFGPAILAPELKGFVLLEEHIDSFRRFARTIDAHIIDERLTPAGPRPLMPECASCGQPAKLDAQPRRCPKCGDVWRAHFETGRSEYDKTTKTCLLCDHEQNHAWPYCAECGEVMPPDPKVPERHIVPPRKRLEDPLPLADVLVETVDLLASEDDIPWSADQASA